MGNRPALDALHALRQSCLALGAMPLALVVCPRCTDALLNDLDALFLTPIPGQEQRRLEGSCVMGFTFTEGPEDVCMLHRVLGEESLHG